LARLTVLDASILLALLYANDPHYSDAHQIVSGGGALATSTITLAESLVRAARDDDADRYLRALTELGVRELPLTTGAAPQLARLRAQTGLKLPDCCVLHAAITSDADAIATRDARLSAVAAAHGFATP
jgi:predicted nucleic acid-binding protein